jgi:hypothetical protein
METSKNDCQACRGCCRFSKEDIEFGPLFTKEEIDMLRDKLKVLPEFKSCRGSSKAFQFELIKSMQKDGSYKYACPFLDEQTHLCDIYQYRPLDCRMWPFLFMRDEENRRSFIACFDMDDCPVTDRMTDSQFLAYRDELFRMIDKEKILHLVKENPDMIWECIEGTFMVAEIDFSKEKYYICDKSGIVQDS